MYMQNTYPNPEKLDDEKGSPHLSVTLPKHPGDGVQKCTAMLCLDGINPPIKVSPLLNQGSNDLREENFGFSAYSGFGVHVRGNKQIKEREEAKPGALRYRGKSSGGIEIVLFRKLVLRFQRKDPHCFIGAMKVPGSKAWCGKRQPGSRGGTKKFTSWEGWRLSEPRTLFLGTLLPWFLSFSRQGLLMNLTPIEILHLIGASHVLASGWPA